MTTLERIKSHNGLEALEKIREKADKIIYTKKQIIFHQDTAQNEVYFLESGLVTVYNKRKSKKFITQIIQANDFLGVGDALSHDQYTLTAEALTNVTLSRISRAVFMELVNSDQSVKNAILNLLCEALNQLQKRSCSLAFDPVRTRMATTLLELEYFFNATHAGLIFTHKDGIFMDGLDGDGHQKDGVHKDGSNNEKVMKWISISRDNLASLIGTSRETAIRMLKDFSDKKIITLEGRKIRILNRARLKELSE